MVSVFLVTVFLLVAVFLWPILSNQMMTEGFVSRPGVIGNIMRHRLTDTPYPNFFAHTPYYNYNYLLGNPYGYFYRYPFYEQEAHCRVFPYYHSYSALTK